MFSPLSDEKYAALKEDIRQNGVLVPVEVDQHGQTLDGHHRIKAWEELRDEGHRVADYPRVIRVFDNDDDREEHAAKINSQRRDISTDDRKRLALRWRERGWSYRRIGSALGVDESTVRYWLPKEDTGAGIPAPDQPERVVGMDGKSYAATKPRPAVMASTARDQERTLLALDDIEEFASTSTGEVLSASEVERRAREHRREAERQQAESIEADLESVISHRDRDGLQRARIRSTVSTAIHHIGSNLTPLKPEAVAEAMDGDRQYQLESFIRKTRSWFDAVEAEMNRGIRVVHREDA